DFVMMTNISFLFQAEDGIRDRNVTGVQTCALPISISLRIGQLYLRHCPNRLPESQQRNGEKCAANCHQRQKLRPDDFESGTPVEIGRASCRERVQMTGEEREGS